MNTVYENQILETKLTELLNSKLEVRSLMTVDDSLKESAGLKKVVNRYTYNGAVETLSGGEKNTETGSVTFTPETYTVKRYQQTFRYNDVEAMQDPSLIDVALAGAADVMANQLRMEYFDQRKHIKNRHAMTGDALSYMDVVEALGDLNREVEKGLFILMGADGRTAIRKDADFMVSQQGQILYSGQFGTLCGIPVLFSKLVPAGTAIITDKTAVKFFVKKEAGLEQSRDIEKKENTIVYERHGVIALVDDTSSVIIGKAAPALTASATVSGENITLTVSGKASASHAVCYLYGADAPLLGEDVSHYTVWDGTSAIAKNGAARLAVAEIGADGKVIKSATVTL